MLKDDQIDLVYIALPHSHHCEWSKAAINAGRNVLCEKAFAVNEKEAREMIGLAEEKKVFITEAIWTRYMPSRKIIKDLLDKNTIDRIISISANLGCHIQRLLKSCGSWIRSENSLASHILEIPYKATAFFYFA